MYYMKLFNSLYIVSVRWFNLATLPLTVIDSSRIVFIIPTEHFKTIGDY